MELEFSNFVKPSLSSVLVHTVPATRVLHCVPVTTLWFPDYLIDPNYALLHYWEHTGGYQCNLEGENEIKEQPQHKGGPAEKVKT